MSQEIVIALLTLAFSFAGGCLGAWGTFRYFMGKAEGQFQALNLRVDYVSESTRDHETRLRQIERVV